MIERVKALPVAEVLDRLGIPHKKGRGWPCPRCGYDKPMNGCGILPKDPSAWHCFQCRESGTAVDIWLLAQGLNPDSLGGREKEALEALVGGESIIASRPEPVEERPAMTPAQVLGWWRISSARGAVWQWLEEARGVRLTSAIANNTGCWTRPGQAPRQRPDLAAAIEAGACAVVPLRSTHPDRLGQVRNLMLRPISPSLIDPIELERWHPPKRYPKPWKMKPVNWGGGSMIDGSFPLVYGDPTGALEADVLVIGEGWMDQVTGEALSQGMRRVRVVTARCADDLRLLMSGWLRGFAGRKIVQLGHLDRPRPEFPRGAGIEAMSELRGQLHAVRPDWCLDSGDRSRVLQWWPWRKVLAEVRSTPEAFRDAGFSDLNDLVRRDVQGPQIPWSRMQAIWKGMVG